jgi:hypothetical protein
MTNKEDLKANIGELTDEEVEEALGQIKNLLQKDYPHAFCKSFQIA